MLVESGAILVAKHFLERIRPGEMLHLSTTRCMILSIIKQEGGSHEKTDYAHVCKLLK